MKMSTRPDRQVERAWLFFQINKTFSLTMFRIYMDMQVKEANKWLCGAVQCVMVKSLGDHTFESTGTYLNLNENVIPEIK